MRLPRSFNSRVSAEVLPSTESTIKDSSFSATINACAATAGKSTRCKTPFAQRRGGRPGVQRCLGIRRALSFSFRDRLAAIVTDACAQRPAVVFPARELISSRAAARSAHSAYRHRSTDSSPFPAGCEHRKPKSRSDASTSDGLSWVLSWSVRRTTFPGLSRSCAVGR